MGKYKKSKDRDKPKDKSLPDKKPFSETKKKVL
jgi:hypothetical protein